jgi:hypothetical protein
VSKDRISKITRLAIVRERQGKKPKEEQVSKTILPESTAEKDHNKEKVKEEKFPDTIGFLVAQERK